MKVVQTFWTQKELDIIHMNGGWMDIRFHLLSWALSATLLRQYFQEIELHTDQLGKELLIDELKLPYKEVHLTQEGLDERYSSKLWVMRKMHTYSLMNEPFLHIDGDVFLFHSLPNHLLNAQIIVQNYQYGFPCYSKAVEQLISAGISLPSAIKHVSGQYSAVNMGVIGGNVPRLFKLFFEDMNEYVNKYQFQILRSNSINKGYLNTLLEECCFFYYIIDKKKKIEPLIDLDQKQDGSYKELGNLIDNRYNYFHLIGSHKKNLFYCKLVEKKLQLIAPDTYTRVTNLVHSIAANNHSVPQLYSSQDPFKESNMRLKEKQYSHRITIKNYHSQLKTFRQINETQICETILFEKEKHTETQEKLYSKAKYIRQEKDRFDCYVNYLELLPIQLRFLDSIKYNAHIPVFRRIVTEGMHKDLEIYLSLVFDFHHGLEHVGEKILSDLSIFILCTIASQKVIIREVIEGVTKKVKPSSSKKRARLLECIDLRIKELYLIGLIDYTIATANKLEKHLNKEDMILPDVYSET